MAATKRNAMLIEEARGKIRTTQLVNRLQDHVDGNVELSPTQVAAAKILLGKCIPDVSAVQSTVTFEDKRDATDWKRDDLVAFLNDAREGRAGTAEADGRSEQPDQVH